jgi:hypothetical protein
MHNNSNFNPEYLGSLTSELAGILRQETEILKTMRIADIKPLLARKQEIALEMEKQRELLHLNPELISSVTAEQKYNLKKIASDYDMAMQDYQVELFKAQRVNAAIIHKLAEYVRDHVQQSRGYNKSGTKNMSGMELAKNTPAIKYNESI